MKVLRFEPTARSDPPISCSLLIPPNSRDSQIYHHLKNLFFSMLCLFILSRYFGCEVKILIFALFSLENHNYDPFPSSGLLISDLASSKGLWLMVLWNEWAEGKEAMNEIPEAKIHTWWATEHPIILNLTIHRESSNWIHKFW